MVSLLDEDNYTDCNKHNHCNCYRHNYNGEATGFARGGPGGSCNLGNLYFFSEIPTVRYHHKCNWLPIIYSLAELSYKLNRVWWIYQVSIKVTRSCILEIKFKALPRGIVHYIPLFSKIYIIRHPINCKYASTINSLLLGICRFLACIDALLRSSGCTARNTLFCSWVPLKVARNTP